MAIKIAAGYLGGILCLLACLAYLRAIVAGKATSNKVTWGIWIIVTFICTASYWQSVNGTTAIWVSLAYCFGTVVTFVCLVAKKSPWQWSAVDVTCLLASVFILAVWTISRSPLTVLTLTLLVDVTGFIPLAVTVYREPEREQPLGWWLGFTANAVNLVAVKQWDYANAAYPCYLVVITLIIALLCSFPGWLRLGRGIHPSFRPSIS